MAQIIGYMAHDAASNMEWAIDDYSTETIERLAADGIIFVAVYDDDSRAVVEPTEVVEPEPQMGGVTLCTPKYVDDRISPIAAALNALKAIIGSDDSAAAADADEIEVAGNPLDAFNEALAALNALENGGGDD